MKVTRSVSIEQEVLNKLQEIADKEFTSVSAIIRQAIHDRIKKESE